MMAAILAVGWGYQFLSNHHERGLTWEGILPSQGGPAVILTEAANGPTSALLSARIARTVVPLLSQGALVPARQHLDALLQEFRADTDAFTILTVHGNHGLAATWDGHRIVSHRGRRGRLLDGETLRPRIAKVAWRPGTTLMALAQSTGGSLPIGSVGRALVAVRTPQEAGRHLIHEARTLDPHLHHGAILLNYPLDAAS